MKTMLNRLHFRLWMHWATMGIRVLDWLFETKKYPRNQWPYNRWVTKRAYNAWFDYYVDSRRTE